MCEHRPSRSFFSELAQGLLMDGEVDTEVLAQVLAQHYDGRSLDSLSRERRESHRLVVLHLVCTLRELLPEGVTLKVLHEPKATPRRVQVDLYI